MPAKITVRKKVQVPDVEAWAAQEKAGIVSISSSDVPRTLGSSVRYVCSQAGQGDGCGFDVDLSYIDACQLATNYNILSEDISLFETYTDNEMATLGDRSKRDQKQRYISRTPFGLTDSLRAMGQSSVPTLQPPPPPPTRDRRFVPFDSPSPPPNLPNYSPIPTALSPVDPKDYFDCPRCLQLLPIRDIDAHIEQCKSGGRIVTRSVLTRRSLMGSSRLLPDLRGPMAVGHGMNLPLPPIRPPANLSMVPASFGVAGPGPTTARRRAEADLPQPPSQRQRLNGAGRFLWRGESPKPEEILELSSDSEATLTPPTKPKNQRRTPPPPYSP